MYTVNGGIKFTDTAFFKAYIKVFKGGLSTKEVTTNSALVKLLATAATLATLGPAAAAAEVLKFSHTDNAGGSRQAAAEVFAEKVSEYTDGRYKVRIFPAGQLVNDPKAIE